MAKKKAQVGAWVRTKPFHWNPLQQGLVIRDGFRERVVQYYEQGGVWERWFHVSDLEDIFVDEVDVDQWL